MHWKRSSWVLIGVLLAACTAGAAAQIATTQVADTVYHADGTPATGTVLISWSAFTTSAGASVPSGNVSTAIAAGGALSVQLVPNAGANPVGTYYTVIYHLDDGTVSRQYWVVPVSITPVRISAIESVVVPLSVALQTVSKNYVDTAIAVAIAAHTSSGGSGDVTYRGGYSTGTTYALHDVVTYNGATYISLSAGNTGNAVTNATYWQVIGGGHTVTLQHTFTGSGTFNYSHNLGSLYPLTTCYVNSGSSTFTANNIDINNIAITVTAASDITCTFGI
jgi:hypothetical protein